MVEILAALLLIAILAVVAVPKYLDIVESGRNKVAQAGMNEAKAALSLAYVKLYLETGVSPDIKDVGIEAFEGMMGASHEGDWNYSHLVYFGDVVVTPRWGDGNTYITLAVLNVKKNGKNVWLKEEQLDRWTMPTSM